MSTQDSVGARPGGMDGGRTASVAGSGPSRERRSTETKAAFKTTELVAYLVATVGVLIAAAVVDQGDAGGLGAKQAWLCVTILTGGYMIGRGLAKSGRRGPYWDDEDSGRHDGRRPPSCRWAPLTTAASIWER